jgi:hypothetical protein
MRRPGQCAKTIGGVMSPLPAFRWRDDFSGVLKLEGGSIRLLRIFSTTSLIEPASTGGRSVRMA